MIGPPVFLLALGFGLVDPQEGQRDRGGCEGGCVEDGDGPAAKRGEQPRAGQRADQPQAFLGGAQQGVRLAEQVVGNDLLEQRGLPGGQHGVCRAVEHHDHVDQPHLLDSVHDEQQQNDAADGDVRPEEQRSPAHPVDEHPGQRREQLGQRKREEDQPGGPVATGQRLYPDRHRKPQGRAPEQGRNLAEQIHEDVPDLQKPANRPHSNLTGGARNGKASATNSTGWASGGRTDGSSRRSR